MKSVLLLAMLISGGILLQDASNSADHSTDADTDREQSTQTVDQSSKQPAYSELEELSHRNYYASFASLALGD